jgi:hypothetical protein
MGRLCLFRREFVRCEKRVSQFRSDHVIFLLYSVNKFRQTAKTKDQNLLNLSGTGIRYGK